MSNVLRVAKRTVVLAVALIVTTAVIVLVSPTKGGWRVQIVRTKLMATTPGVSWLDCAAAMLPSQLFLARERAMRLVPKESKTAVTLARVERGPCPAVWNTPFGQVHGHLTDAQVLHQIAREQLVDRLYDYPQASVRAGDVVLDVGGHLGTFALFALHRGAAKVVVYEPEPGNVACLERTLAQEIISGRVVIEKAAAWDSAGVLRFEEGAESSAEGGIRESGTIEVPAVTIDESVERLRLSRVDFVKMDIEGAERHALAGAARTIARDRPRMAICVYHIVDDPEVLPALILKARPDYVVMHHSRQHYFY